MKKQRILSAAAAAVICLSLAPAKVQADEDYSDTSYWTKQCTDTSNLNGGMKSSCQAFYNYISSQSDSLNAKLKDIDAQRSTISANIDEYTAKIADYQNQINDLNSQIDTVQAEITDLDSQICELQQVVDDLKADVSAQIENSQSSMRLSKVFDILMGARSFDQLIKLANGISDITEYDNRKVSQLKDKTDELNTTKQQKADAQADLKSKQEDVLAQEYQAQVVMEEYKAQKEQLTKEYNDAQVQIDDTTEIYDSLSDAIAQAEKEAQEKAAAEAAARAAAQQAAANAAAQKQTSNAAAQQQTSNVTNNTSASTTPTYSGTVGHATGDYGNAYPWGQCTWYAYKRRHDLGLPCGSYFGNARSWAGSAASLGYSVDHNPQVHDIVVFMPGQAGADAYYGHVAVVEAVGNGYIVISESNARGLGVISNRICYSPTSYYYIHN